MVDRASNREDKLKTEQWKVKLSWEIKFTVGQKNTEKGEGDFGKCIVHSINQVDIAQFFTEREKQWLD